MTLPNFNSIDPSIAWYKSEPPDPKAGPLNRFFSDLREDPLLAVPPLIASLTIATLGISNFVVQSSVTALTPNHNKLLELDTQFKVANSTNSKLQGELQEAGNFLVQSVHVYVFAKLLQELVPLDVQLKEYNLTMSTISIEATSYKQQSINDFIAFFSAHPLIQEGSVKIVDLTTTSAINPQTKATDTTNQPRQRYILKLTGIYLNPNEAELIKLFAKAGNTGLLDKLQEISPQTQR